MNSLYCTISDNCGSILFFGTVDPKHHVELPVFGEGKFVTIDVHEVPAVKQEKVDYTRTNIILTQCGNVRCLMSAITMLISGR